MSEPNGYCTHINVGGDMTTGMDDSRFPFYCAHCGLVDVNTALAVSECPNCGTADIAQYGRPPVAVVPSRKYLVPRSQSNEAGRIRSSR